MESTLSLWPTLSEAAGFLGVSRATLSRRRHDLNLCSRGKDEVISPVTVMSLACHYRKRVVDEVAWDLVELARRLQPGFAGLVAADIDAFMGEPRPRGEEGTERFLAMAEARLPPGLYAQVARAAKAESPGVLADA